MYGPTCIFWATLTPSSRSGQRRLPERPDGPLAPPASSRHVRRGDDGGISGQHFLNWIERSRCSPGGWPKNIPSASEWSACSPCCGAGFLKKAKFPDGGLSRGAHGSLPDTAWIQCHVSEFSPQHVKFADSPLPTATPIHWIDAHADYSAALRATRFF